MEIQSAARTVRDVAQVAQQRALMAFFDFGVQFERFIVANGVQEIRNVFCVATAGWRLQLSP